MNQVKQKAMPLPPHCPEAEIQLIGGLIQAPETLQKVAAICCVDDLYNPAHRIIYQAMFDLEERSEPVDPVSNVIPLVNILREGGQLQNTGGASYLAKLVEETPTAANIEYYAKKVKEAANRRKIIACCHDAMTRAGNSGDTGEVIFDLTNAIEKISEGKSTSAFLTSSELLRLEENKERPIIAGGILPAGGSLLIAGESGIGKSLLRTEIAIRFIMGWQWLGFEVPTARRVLIVSFENPMGSEKYRLQKMLAGLQISALPDTLSFADQKTRVDLKLKKDRQRLLDIVQRSKTEVVIYDPLSSLHSSNENDNIEVRAVLDTLSEINRRCGTSCVVIHHYGKPSPEQSNEHRTRGASSIRDWTDTLIGITKRAHEHKTLRLLEFHKVRHGPQPKPILIERDENFVHHKVDEDMICPPSRVAEILKNVGGEVDSQSEFAKAIAEETGCSQRSAITFIQLALEKETIIEMPGQGKNRKRYIIKNELCNKHLT